MEIKFKINPQKCIKFLIILLVINYSLITVVLKNYTFLGYFRDILLLFLLLFCVKNGRIRLNINIIVLIIWFISVIIGMIKAENTFLAFQETRRYIFPLIVFIITMNFCCKEWILKLSHFAIYFFSFLSIWGIFQALILKDTFLMKIGYPLRYAPEYGRMALYNSYYFGGLGIQRVVATFSSSNICGMALGVTLIFLIMNYKLIKNIKYKDILLGIITAGYLLTFSRSNFLAAFIVIVFIVWPYIPHKKELIITGILVISGIIFFVIFQKADSILSKLLDWISNSIHFNDTSSAGRLPIWTEAFRAVIHNPLGIGMGHVGDNSFLANSSYTYACENSYFAMALDIGWIGTIVYYGNLFAGIIYMKKKYKYLYKHGEKQKSTLCKSGMTILIYTIIVMFFSNHIIDMEVISLIYIYIGMAFWVSKSKNINIENI